MIGGAGFLIILAFIGIHDVSASAGDRSQLFINCLRGCRHNNCTEGNCNQPNNQLNPIWLDRLSLSRRRTAVQKRHRTRMGEWDSTLVVSRWMRLRMHVAHNKCICRPTMGRSAILWQMAVQTILRHPGAGVGALFAAQPDRSLENAAKIPRRCTQRQSHVLRLACVLCGTNPLSISPSFTWFTRIRFSFLFSDLHKWLDVFNDIPHARFSTHRTARLRFCLFNGSSELLLHASQVTCIRLNDSIALIDSPSLLPVHRMLHWTSKKVKTVISLTLFIFFVNHFAYLSVGRFDYAYNMKANVLTGIATGVGWIGWYVMQRRRKPYAWKILLFQILVGISLLLELNDFPPLFWVLDAHSLWHLSTVLPSVLLYR